jgi:hypothetical protein
MVGRGLDRISLSELHNSTQRLLEFLTGHLSERPSRSRSKY